jgi:hypothetical protein
LIKLFFSLTFSMNLLVFVLNEGFGNGKMVKILRGCFIIIPYKKSLKTNPKNTKR